MRAGPAQAAPASARERAASKMVSNRSRWRATGWTGSSFFSRQNPAPGCVRRSTRSPLANLTSSISISLPFSTRRATGSIKERHSPIEMSNVLSRAGLMKKPASYRNRCISALSDGMCPVWRARRRIPRTPVCGRPSFAASKRAADSSNNTKPALISNARLKASASPRSSARMSSASTAPVRGVTRIQPSRIAAASAARASVLGFRLSSASTAGGITTIPSCSRTRSKRPMMARFESGDVLLTTRIAQVGFEIRVRVFPWDAALR